MTPAQIEAYVDAAAAVLDLPLDAEHRPGVLRYFEIAAGMAAMLEADAADVLAPHDDPAESFVPIEPDASSLAHGEQPH